MLKEAHESVSQHVSNLMGKKDIKNYGNKTAEKQCKDTYKLWICAKASQILSAEILLQSQQYMAALNRVKSANAAWKLINGNAIDAYTQLVKELSNICKAQPIIWLTI